MFMTELFKHLTYRLFAPGALLRARYDAFKRLLELDKECLELIADLEDIAFGGLAVDHARAAKLCSDLALRSSALCDTLVSMNPARYVGLGEYQHKIEFYMSLGMSLPDPETGPPYVLPLPEAAGRPDEAGGKAANLGRAMRLLGQGGPGGVSFAPGFVVTTRACEYLVEYGGLRPAMNDLLARIRLDKREGMFHICRELEGMLMSCEVPPAVEDALTRAVEELMASLPRDSRLAVRSSAVGEDSEVSFAGQYHSELEVAPADFMAAYKRVVASKYASRAVTYRILRGYADQESQMAVVVMPMIRAAAAGVLYTRDPAGGDQDSSVVYAVPGLGTRLVEGEVCPDEMRFQALPPHEFISRKAACPTRSVKTMHPSDTPVVDQDPAQALVRAAALLAGDAQAPLDLEWAVDKSGNPFILQARPLRGLVEQAPAAPLPVPPELGAPLIDRGEIVSLGRAAGPAYTVDKPEAPGDVPKGAVIITRTLSPELIRVLPRARAVLADRGSRASHFASVAREFGVPVFIPDGLENRENLRRQRDGAPLFVDCFAGKVYKARPEDLAREVERPLPAQGPLGRRLTTVMNVVSKLNLTNPEAEDFTPAGCRSMHDLVRFCHESAVREMFSLAGGGPSLAGAKRMASPLPLMLTVLDVDDGLNPEAAGLSEVTPEMAVSAPFRALWRGLSDQRVAWDKDRPNFDWASMSDFGQGGGIVAPKSGELGSYAVLGRDYMHFLVRFGFHFAVVDSLCGATPGQNYVNFRFKGGGGEPSRRLLRLAFIRAVLEPLGFGVRTRGDMLDASYTRNAKDATLARLAAVGYVLGVSRLMDMVLDDETHALAAAAKCLDTIRSFSLLLGMDG